MSDFKKNICPWCWQNSESYVAKVLRCSDHWIMDGTPFPSHPWVFSLLALVKRNPIKSSHTDPWLSSKFHEQFTNTHICKYKWFFSYNWLQYSQSKDAHIICLNEVLSILQCQHSAVDASLFPIKKLETPFFFY